MKIAFLTTGHSAYDDRIYYHLATTLAEAGHNILIVSSGDDSESDQGGITVKSFRGKEFSNTAKIAHFIDSLIPFAPDKTICSEPLAVIAAVRYGRKYNSSLKTFYDITEWYPSPRFLGRYNIFAKWIGFIMLFAANITASLICDAFIFGEKLKSRPYRFLFPYKPFCFITYYPDLRYFQEYKHSLSPEKIRLSFSGDTDKGFGNFLEVVYRIAEKYYERSLEVKVLGKCDQEVKVRILSGKRPENIFIEFTEAVGYREYIDLIKGTDIFLELRKRNFENNNSLPIKLFIYAALGRPVIITDLRSLREYPEIKSFGHITDPEDYERIVSLVSKYLNDSALYNEDCNKARQLAEEKFNWNILSPRFLSFIQGI
jgi:glycosyltransferase involved in cell wall biosynthesis